MTGGLGEANVGNGSTLIIGTEKVYVMGVSGSFPNYTVTSCTRAYASTTATSYTTGQVFTVEDSLHLNSAGYTGIKPAQASLFVTP